MEKEIPPQKKTKLTKIREFIQIHFKWIISNIIIVGVGFFLTYFLDVRQQDFQKMMNDQQQELQKKLTDKQIESQEKIAKVQNQFNLTQRIDNYYQGVTELLKVNPKISNSILIARTNIILAEVEQTPKITADILRFLSDIGRSNIFDRANGSNQFISLSGKKLKGMNLQNINLRGANLSGAILEETNFISADLSRVDLSNTNLSKGDFTNAIFQKANLTGADFSGATLKGADFGKVVFIFFEEPPFDLDPNPSIKEVKSTEAIEIPDWIKEKLAEGKFSEGNSPKK